MKLRIDDKAFHRVNEFSSLTESARVGCGSMRVLEYFCPKSGGLANSMCEDVMESLLELLPQLFDVQLDRWRICLSAHLAVHAVKVAQFVGIEVESNREAASTG